jgi:VanZ family protein
MKFTKKRLAVCLCLLVAILAFIWGNSAMPGEASGELSDWLGDFLGKFLPFLNTESGLHFLRKAAHFSEFAALGMILSWLFGMVSRRKLWQHCLPLLCGVAAAGIDETIQIFSPGRHCSIVDVGIDSAGVLTGIALVLLSFALLRRLRKDT